MPAARCSVVSRSTLYASSTTSCDADSTATPIASAASSSGSLPGSTVPMNAIAAISPICVASTQPRRRPRNGHTNRSSSGAHANLNVYASPTDENAAIWSSGTCSAVSHACSVEPVRYSGSPDENPSRNSTAIRRERNTSNHRGPTSEGVWLNLLNFRFARLWNHVE
jgi:hypothetical protein